jgi:2-dehydropantoate 2-reductase
MRVLVIGAGALGGYFGARLSEAGRDVTFLVRRKRAADLRKGLSVKSKFGDINLPSVPTVTADRLNKPFDLILLSCKAYDLEDAMNSFAPAVGSNTVILPLLNGFRHMELLSERFGKEKVFGGQSLISATVDQVGQVIHLNDLHFLTFGEQDGSMSDRVKAITTTLSNAKFVPQPSDAILQEMWEKWVFIATGAGITCLMRSAIGDIEAADAADLAIALFNECGKIATAQGFPPRQTFIERSSRMFTTPGSPLTASMLRDIERGAPTEADHVLGDLLRRGNGGSKTNSLLRIAYAHVKSYEARREREATSVYQAG